MIRYFIVLVTCVMMSASAFSQPVIDSSLVNVLAGNSCNCLDKVAKVNESDVLDCLYGAMMKDSVLVLDECRRLYGDSAEYYSRSVGKELGGLLMVKMVANCDKVYAYYDRLLDSGMSKINVDSLKGEMNKSVSALLGEPNLEYLVNQGKVLIAERKWDSALVCFDKALALDGSNVEPQAMKAFVLGKLGRGEEGAAIFEDIARRSGQQTVYVLAEIIRRKQVRK